jgi:hypothetical protein
VYQLLHTPAVSTGEQRGGARHDWHPHFEKREGGGRYLIYAVLDPDTVAAHCVEGGAWQDMTSNTPNDDLLRVAPRSHEQLRGHCVPIGFAIHPEEHEDFSGIGGVTPTRARSTASRHANTTHTLGETCVV